jgi:hypothetical protein
MLIFVSSPVAKREAALAMRAGPLPEKAFAGKLKSLSLFGDP